MPKLSTAPVLLITVLIRTIGKCARLASSFQHPKDFVPEIELAGSPRAGYPANAVVFSFEDARLGKDIVAAIVAILDGIDIEHSG